jgi:hypothetical protein
MNPFRLETTNTTGIFCSAQATLLETTIAPLPLHEIESNMTCRRAVSVASVASIGAAPCSFTTDVSTTKSVSGAFGNGKGLKRRTSSANTFRTNASFSTRSRTSSGHRASQTFGSNSTLNAIQGIPSVSGRNWNACAVVQTAQRSNASTVKSVIVDLTKVCESPDLSEPPIEFCSMLALWASVDAYYKVVISKYNGIQVTVRAMRAFPQCADLQATCCTILAHLSNKCLICQEMGAQAIVAAMQGHPCNIIVQSAALEALRPLTPFLLQERAVLHEIETLLARTKDMYLTEAGCKAALDISIFLANAPPPAVLSTES